MTKLTKRVLQWAGMALIALTATVTCIAFSVPTPDALYKPENKVQMTQAQQWQLDFELANEYFQYANNRRFMRMADRWVWYDEIAKGYEVADLVRQTINTRPSSSDSYEPAFNRLVELGKAGDISARCFAWFIHGHLDKNKTKSWKYSFEDVAKLALEVKDSGHPICKGMEGSMYLHGKLGYAQDKKKAKPFFIERATLGFYGSQEYLAGQSSQSYGSTDTKKLALELCWGRLASRQSQHSSFELTCKQLTTGIESRLKRGTEEKPEFDRAEVSAEIKETARLWCPANSPKANITAQDCAQLELDSPKE